MIYLAFFLPMALTRMALVHSGLDIDIGWACMIVTGVAVIVPLAFERAIRGTRLKFLFERPAAFHIAAGKAEASVLRPA